MSTKFNAYNTLTDMNIMDKVSNLRNLSVREDLYRHKEMVVKMMVGVEPINEDLLFDILSWIFRLEKIAKSIEVDKMGVLKSQLDALSDDERTDLFSYYCKACGSKDKNCQCWNDE